MRFLLAAVVLIALPASAQSPCTNGFATLTAPAPGAPTQGPFACSGVDLMSYIPAGESGALRTGGMNDVWGWTDPTTGREYALAGTRSGTVFVDVTNPTTPQVLGKLGTQTGNSTWRDIKVYQNHAFVVSEASGHGMQVFDLTRLRGLTANAQRDFTADAVYTGIGKAHNLVINEATGYAYAVGANQSGRQCNGGGLHIIDIRTPLTPTFAGCFDNDGYTHDAQCVIYSGPDTDYTGRELCFNSNEDTVTIVDVTNHAAPVQISRNFYPNPVYTHQNWLTEDQGYLMVDDEVDSSSNGTRTIVMDVRDLDNAAFAFFYFGTNPVTDHNQYVRGNYSFQSNYEGGLRILDISQVSTGAVTENSYFDTFPQQNDSGYNGQWSNYPYFASGIVVATDIDNGLFILRPQVLAVDSAVPVSDELFTLSAAQPNPASVSTTLALRVQTPQAVRAILVDASGRTVATLLDAVVTAEAATTLDVPVSDLAAGVYLVRVQGEAFTTSRQITVTR